MNLLLKSLLILLICRVNCLTPSQLSCCPQTYIFDKDTLSCVCPLTAQYRDAQNRCVVCNAPSRWDPTSLTCQKCRLDQTQVNGICVCPRENPFDNGSKCVPCPQNKPVWNGKTCVACPTNTHYDIPSKTCTVCPPGLDYNAATRNCDIQI